MTTVNSTSNVSRINIKFLIRKKISVFNAAFSREYIDHIKSAMFLNVL